ncbi:C2H2 and C2HC zinc finger [Glarea lozoyensis ATCC 20868]|uniref:C2H2 and C2HC zinc finger n=1 Tax=Glarea lozoyensis (strain ATCC 20868 / MF5171) TaxID=1116229 RepID=S3D7Z1_GLAL2|nr:C2H2 and C2HC zinc finger [Glarea lozoyensis ATCC 20868]EPE33229.1 C2H2 and C2HC zinc finger [Glarea lozoyensis ATCC 20868]
MGGSWTVQAAEQDQMIDPLHVNPLLLTTTKVPIQNIQIQDPFEHSTMIPGAHLLNFPEENQFHAPTFESTTSTDESLWPTVLPPNPSVYDTTHFTGGYFPQTSTEIDYISESSFTESDCFTTYPVAFGTISTNNDSSQLDLGEQPGLEASLQKRNGRNALPRCGKSAKTKAGASGESINNPIKIRKARSKIIQHPKMNTLEKAFKAYSNAPSFKGFKLLMDEAMSYGEMHMSVENTSILRTPSASQESVTGSDISDINMYSDHGSNSSNGCENPAVYTSDGHDNWNRTTREPDQDTKPRFACTFKSCKQNFSAYSDWKRHEENQDHYPQERYMCLQCLIPEGVPTDNTFCEICRHRFCRTEDVEAHYRLCLPDQDNPKYTFTRKYHLNSHLRRQHNVGMVRANELSGNWKYSLTNNWPRQCHLCNVSFTNWKERMKHIAKHYQRGEDRPPGPDHHRKDDESDEDNDEDDNDNNGPPRKRIRSNVQDTASSSAQPIMRGRTASDNSFDANSSSNFHSAKSGTPRSSQFHRLYNPHNFNAKSIACYPGYPSSKPKVSQKQLDSPSDCINWNRLFMLNRYLRDADEGVRNGWNWSDVSDFDDFIPPPLPRSSSRRIRRSVKRTVRLKATLKLEQLTAAIEYIAQNVRALPNGVFWFSSSIKQDVKDNFWDIALQAIHFSPKDNPTVFHVYDSWWREEGAAMSPSPTIDCSYLVIAAWQEADVVHLEWTLDQAWEKIDAKNETQDLQSLQALFHLYTMKSRSRPFTTPAVDKVSAAHPYRASTQKFVDFLTLYKRSFGRKLTTKALGVFFELEAAQHFCTEQWLQTLLEKESLKRRLQYLKKSDSRLFSTNAKIATLFQATCKPKSPLYISHKSLQSSLFPDLMKSHNMSETRRPYDFVHSS